MMEKSQSFGKGNDYYGEVRSDLLALAPDIQGHVLEIGCAQGRTMEYLRDRLGCTVVGLDYCEEALAAAREKGLRVHACDLNRDPLPFGAGEFDYIVIGDVLEHLYDPWSVLGSVAGLLKDGGTLLASIPNIKHYSILKDLILRDKWEYRESGILDSTHIRFFTLSGIRGLFEMNRLQITRIGFNLAASNWVTRLNRLCNNRLVSFLAGQYLIAAKKSARGS